MDLAAEKLLIAEKGTQKIAVEIKTFSGDSEVADLEQVNWSVLYLPCCNVPQLSR